MSYGVDSLLTPTVRVALKNLQEGSGRRCSKKLAGETRVVMRWASLGGGQSLIQNIVH